MHNQYVLFFVRPAFNSLVIKMSPSTYSYEIFSAAFSCVAWLLALPVGIALTATLAGVQNNSQNNAGQPRI